MLRGLLLSFVLLISGCSNDKLPRFTTIQGLRVLALTASDPEINYDGTNFTPSTVTFQPWISDTYGAGRSLLANVYWCVDPGIGLGAVPTCDGNPTRVDIATAQSITSTATFLSPNYVGALGTFAIDFSAASTAILALISSKFSSSTIANKFNGISILVFYEVYPAANPSLKVSSFKRVVLSDSSKTAKNQNPTGLEIRLAGTEISGLPTTSESLEAFLPASSTETYLFLSEQGFTQSLTEDLETTWFLTGPENVECSRKKECTPDGFFSLSRTRTGELNKFNPPQVSVPATRGRVLIAVARDSRGGIAVKRYCDGVLCP